MERRIEVLMQNFPENVDAVLISGYEIRRYYTRTAIPGALLLVTKSAAWIFVSSRWQKEAAAIPEVISIPGNHVWENLNETLSREGIRNLAVQADEIRVSEYERLKRTAPCEIIADGRLDAVIYRQNCIKSEEEVQKLQRAQDIADKTFRETLNYIHAGMSDWELQKIVGTLFLDFGSEWDHFGHVMGVGVNTSLPHVRPNGTVIQPGDFVMVDIGGMVDGYGSDMTRMFAIEYADDRKREIYEIVRAAQKAGREAIALGRPCCEVDRAAREIIEEAGYGKNYLHGLGHTVGICVPGGPRFNQTDTTPLFSGLIMTVEPGIYLPGEFGVRIEDMMHITEDGVYNMTHSPHELIVV